MVVRGLISLVLVILAGYGIFEAAPLIRGPVVSLESPAFATSPDGFFTVAGTASHTQSLTLNGSPLPVDESGRFSRFISLPSGGSILTLEAGDRFGRTISKRVTVFVPRS